MGTGVRDVPASGLPVGLAVFLRELKDAVENAGAISQAVVTQVTSFVSSGGGSGGEGDFSKPPNVSGLTALVSTKFIAITWDIPSPNNISHTEIWRSIDTLGNAKHVGSSPFGFFQDMVGYGSPEYRYWARHVRANLNSPVYGDFAGPVMGQTPPELESLLDLLEGELTASHLVTALQNRINLIDTPTTGLVAQIATETNLRIDGDAMLAEQIETIISTSGGAIFVQATAPADSPPGTLGVGDRWFDSDDGNKPYIWDDTANVWVDITDSRIISNIAAITTINTAVASLTANKAEASTVTTLQSTVGANTSLLAVHAAVIDGIEGEFYVKIDAAGHVSGFGLKNDATGSAFVVSADLFAVGKPGQTTRPLFAVGTVGGVSAIILNAQALMGDASIKNAMIENLAANKLFAVTGTLAEAIIGTGHINNAMIGNVIQSDNWNSTTKTGWRLTKATGLIEGNGVTIYDGAGSPIFGSGTGFNLNWVRVNGTGKPEDGATAGAVQGRDLVAPVFEDSFEYIDQWQIEQGAGSIAIVSDPDAGIGGKALEATGYVLMAAKPKFDMPFDPESDYELRVRARDVGANTLVIFLGLAGVASDKVTLVGTDGVNSYSNQMYLAANGLDPSNGYVEYVGYLKGYGVSVGSSGGNALGNPGKAHPNVRYLRPIMYLNYPNGVAAKTRVARFSVRRVQPQITSANISTYIAGAAIGTLFLGEHQVTIPVSSESASRLIGSGAVQLAAAIVISLDVPGFIQILWALQQGYVRTSKVEWGYEIRLNGAAIDSRIGTRSINDQPAGMARAMGVVGLNRIELFWYGSNDRVHLMRGSLLGLATVR